jgi:Protein of unknown function (DUF1566)
MRSNVKTFGNKLRSVIEDQLRSATPRQVLAIASALCTDEVEIAQAVAPASASRFETRGNLVIDHHTGLMWDRQTMPGGRMPWAKAKEACSLYDLGGYMDWRLPTIRELLSLVDYQRHDPTIDTNTFQCESAWYWTSTPYAPSPGDFAWGVGFSGGFAGWVGQGYGGFVRACRAGQSVEHWF